MSIFSTIKKNQKKRNRQDSLIMNITVAERSALAIFMHYLIPVYVQIEIQGFYVDFMGVDRNFILELDGYSHVGTDEYDDKRSKFFSQCGFDVYRLENKYVTDEYILDIVRQTKRCGIEKMNELITHAKTTQIRVY
jgi:very-short-patch-repair endonuclease